MEEPTFETHPFSYSSSISNESKEVKPVNGMEESVSFGRFASESLSWEKWSTFNRNRYVEEAEKHSKPGSVMQKKAFLEAHFKRMNTHKDDPPPTASPESDLSISIQQQPSTQPNQLPSEPIINHQQDIDKEDSGDKSSNAQVHAVELEQLTDVNPVAETGNELTNEQELGLQSSSVNQENSAPEVIKTKTPLSSYIPSVEAGSSLISSSTQQDSAAAHPVKEMGKKRSPLYKSIIKKITLSSKASKNSRLKTSHKYPCREKPQSTHKTERQWKHDAKM